MTQPGKQPLRPSDADGPAPVEPALDASPGPRRQRRFSIPDPQDHRLSERLEAFLDGPAPKTPSQADPEQPLATLAPLRPASSRAPVALDSRADWNEALRYEGARHERYGRPVAVAVIDLVVVDESGREPAKSSIDVAASVVGRVLRSSMRLPDRIARVAPSRFHVLLPETNRGDARRFAERARRAAESVLSGGAVQVSLRIAIAAPTREEPLPAALATAELQLAG